MHFIKDLLENPMDKDPVKNLLHVHRHFIRYSRGFFDGPQAKIRFGKKITINGSFEFEDLFAWLGALAIDSSSVTDDIMITGNIISGGNFAPILAEIGLSELKVSKSKGQTKNYKCVLKTPASISPKQLISLVEKLNRITYILLTFNNGEVILKTKKNPPRPNPKGSKDDKKKNPSATNFTSIKIPFSEEIKKKIIEEMIPEFKDEVLSNTKLIEIESKYNIEELIIPPRDKIKNSGLIRKLTLRKGQLKRVCIIDGARYDNEIEIII